MRGELILDNLPSTLQTFDIKSYTSYLSINLTNFPDLTQLYNLTFLAINMYRTVGVADNLGSKCPLNLQSLMLHDFIFDQFPDVSSLVNLNTFFLSSNRRDGIGYYGNNTATDAGLKLPPNVQWLTLDQFRIDEFPDFGNLTSLMELYLEDLYIIHANMSGDRLGMRLINNINRS